MKDDSVNVNIMGNALHYGQAAFEGLKAHHTKQGHVNVFNAIANAKR